MSGNPDESDGGSAVLADSRTPRATGTTRPGEAGSPAAGRSATESTSLLRSGYTEAIPAAVTFLVMVANLGIPSFNRDEAATISAVHRSLPQLIHMLGNLDAVHGAYYVTVWFTVRIFGPVALAPRFPSLIAMVVAAAMITVIGRRVLSRAAGIAAGLVFAFLPIISFYGQDARSPAMVTGLATVASYLFVRVLQAPADRRTRWLVWYGVSLAVLGIFNIFGLLLIPAHAATLALGWRRGESDQWRLAIRWLIVAVIAVILVGPVMIVAWPQRSQISWLGSSSNGKLITLTQLAGPRTVTLGMLALIIIGVGFSAWRGRERLRANWPMALTGLSVPWLVLPPFLLLVASQLIMPAFVLRYVLFCLPAASLLVGAALAALGRYAGPVLLIALAAAGLPAQLGDRGQAGHGDNIRAIDRIISVQSQPGDKLLYGAYVNGNMEAPYRYGLAQLPDIGLAKTPIQSNTLTGTVLPVSKIRANLAGVQRLWVVEINRQTQVPALAGEPFHLVRSWQRTDLYLLLYVRDGAG